MLCFYKEGFFFANHSSKIYDYRPKGFRADKARLSPPILWGLSGFAIPDPLEGWSGFAIPDPLEGRISFGDGFVIPNNLHHMNMLLLETNVQDCHVSSTLNLKIYFHSLSPTLIHYRA